MSVTKLLLDTNVWLDYFLARTPGHAAATELVALAADAEDLALYTSSLSIKDVAYLLERDMKAGARESGVTVTEDVAAAAREVAWGCVRLILKSSLIVPVGHPEVLQAFTLKSVHDDLEDDLLIGLAYRAEVDYVVTYDAKLARRSPVPCLDVSGALNLALTRPAAGRRGQPTGMGPGPSR